MPFLKGIREMQIQIIIPQGDQGMHYSNNNDTSFCTSCWQTFKCPNIQYDSSPFNSAIPL